MAGRSTLRLAVPLSLGLLWSCQAKPGAYVPPPAPQLASAVGALGAVAVPDASHVGPRATVRLQLPVQAPQRALLAIGQSQRLRLVYHGPDLAAPIVTPPMTAFPASLMTFSDVPVGPVRLLGLEWLDAQDKPINGGPQWALGPVVEKQTNDLAITPASQIAGEAMVALVAADKAAAAKVVPLELIALLRRAQESLRLADVRMISPEAVAASLKSGLPAEPPASWAAGLMGQVSVRPRDWPPNMNVRLMLNDSLSASIILNKPDTVVLGPVPPRSAPYQLRVVPLDIDGIGNYVEAPWAPASVPVTVSAGQVAKVDFSFVSGRVGAAMPLRVAPAASASVVVNQVPELWLLGGVTAPAVMDGIASPPAKDALVTQPYLKALRYRRAGGWSEVLTLPQALPRLITAVGFGSDVYLFGGLDGQNASTKVWKLAAGANPPTLTALPAAMPVGLVGAAGGVVGDRILLAGGLRADGTGYPGLLAFTPATGAIVEEVASGNPEPLVDAAGVGLGKRLYLFGGFSPAGVGAATPSTRNLAYDTDSKDFRNLRRLVGPRRGATAVAHDAKLYVVGGDGLRATPSAAVEVFDPNVGRWALKAPLRVGRGRPAVGVMPTAEGLPALVVAGGGLGMPTFFGGEGPVAASAVEELTP